MSLLDDLKGLEKFIHLGALQCGVCREEYGKCEGDCFSRFLPWLAKKLSEDGYVKKSDLEAEGYVKAVRCGECKYDSASCDVKVFAPGLTYCSEGVLRAKSATTETAPEKAE